MPQLSASVFRNYFGGSWSARVLKNGVFQREIAFNWPELEGTFSAVGAIPGLEVPRGCGVLDDTTQVSVAGWRPDLNRWCSYWYNEFGGFGELQWSSMEEVDGRKVLYGFARESKQQSDDPTDHIAKCEIIDANSFKYTLKSFKKGMLEITATRLQSQEELNDLMSNNKHNLFEI